MNFTNPVVSVVVPIYNAAPTLNETLQSICDQTAKNIEIVLLDNGSDDGSTEIINSWAQQDNRIRVLRWESVIPAHENFTKAIESATGDFVKLICGDDLIDSTCISEQLEVMVSNPDISFCSVNRRIIDGGGKVILSRRGFRGRSGQIPRKTAIKRSLMGGGNLLEGTAASLYRTSAAKAALPFTDKYSYLIDLDFCIRALDHGDFYHLDKVLASYRVRSDSESSTMVNVQKSQLLNFVNELKSNGTIELSPIQKMIFILNLSLQVLARRVIYFFLKNRSSSK